MPTLDDFDASIGVKRVPEPGDPDYNWSANAGYDPKDKLVGDAKQTLAKSQQLADSSGLTQIEQNPPATTPQPPSSADTLGNFLKNAWQAFPLNPSNVVESAKAMVPGTDANQRYQQSLYEHPIMSALREASPLTGGAGLQAGQRIAQGDVSGSLGELAGEMSGVALPLVLPEIPGAVRTATDATGRGIGAVGRGMEAVGASAPTRAGGNLATLNAIVRPSWGSVAMATIPPALEYGGRGLQRIGEAIQGLTKGANPVEQFRPVATSGYRAAPVSSEVPGFSYPSDSGPANMPTFGKNAAQYQRMADRGAFAGDRTTGHFEPTNVFTGKPIGLASLQDVAQTSDQGAPTVHVPDDFSVEGVPDVPSSAGNRANLQPTLARLERAKRGALGRDSTVPNASAPTRKLINVEQNFGNLEVNHLAKQTGKSPQDIQALLDFAHMMQEKGAQLGSPAVQNP